MMVINYIYKYRTLFSSGMEDPEVIYKIQANRTNFTHGQNAAAAQLS